VSLGEGSKNEERRGRAFEFSHSEEVGVSAREETLKWEGGKKRKR